MKKRKLIRLLAFVIVFALTTSCFITNIVFAEQTEQKQKLEDNPQKIDELIGYGLTYEESVKILRVDRILNEMIANDQKLSFNDGKVEIFEYNKDKGSISANDRQWIIKVFSDFVQQKHKTQEEKLADIDKAKKANPGKSSYRINYEDGSWIEAGGIVIAADDKNPTVVRTYGSGDWYSTSQKMVCGNGSFYYTNYVEGLSGPNWCRQWLTTNSNIVNYGVLNSTWTKTYTGRLGTRSYYGTCVPQNDPQPDAPANTVTNYATRVPIIVYYTVTFAASAALDFSFGPFFSVNISQGGTWQQTLKNTDLADFTNGETAMFY